MVPVLLTMNTKETDCQPYVNLAKETMVRIKKVYYQVKVYLSLMKNEENNEY